MAVYLNNDFKLIEKRFMSLFIKKWPCFANLLNWSECKVCQMLNDYGKLGLYFFYKKLVWVQQRRPTLSMSCCISALKMGRLMQESTPNLGAFATILLLLFDVSIRQKYGLSIVVLATLVLSFFWTRKSLFSFLWNSLIWWIVSKYEYLLCWLLI